MRRERQGMALCVAAAVGFGTTTIFVTLAYRAHVAGLTLLALRFTLSAALLVGVVTWRTRTVPLRWSRRTLGAGFLLGFAVISLQTSLLFAAVAQVGAALAEVMHYTYPALVTVSAMALGRERPDVRRLLALGFALVGVALVLLSAGIGAINALGIAYALGSAGSYTAYILLSDRLTGTLDPLLLTTLICAGAATAFLAASLVSGPSFSFAPLGWVWLAALVVAATVLPLIAFLAGLARLGPSPASILSTIEPIITVVLAFILFGQRFTAPQL